MSKHIKIDLNCDLGEGLNNEHLLMPYLSSCNIACGEHAGSVEIMDEVITLALRHQVKIGAHPSFPDRKNFGRVIMKMTDAELHESLKKQLLLFKERAAKQAAPVHHVKPHGALYQLIAVNAEKAAIVAKVVQHVFPAVKLYVPFKSTIASIAQEYNIELVYEAFADRNYNDDLTLMSRTLPQAIITEAAHVVAHVKRMIEKSKVKTIQGNDQTIKAETFCVHGDNVNAEEILGYLHKEILSAYPIKRQN